MKWTIVGLGIAGVGMQLPCSGDTDFRGKVSELRMRRRLAPQARGRAHKAMRSVRQRDEADYLSGLGVACRLAGLIHGRAIGASPRKTRAAVGKPPAAVDHWGCGPEYFGAASLPLTLAESARLMPVTASPLPASAGAHAGLIS